MNETAPAPMVQTASPMDQRLVEEARQGAPRAFNQLVDRHFDRVYTVAYARLGNREAAEDLVQEVFLRAFLHLGDLRDAAQFLPWVLRITRNLSANWVRSGVRASRVLPMVPLDERIPEMPDTARPDARASLEATEQERLLQAALARLTPEEREVVLMHFHEDVSQAEIARRQGVHPATVGRRLESILGRLRAGMQAALEPTLRVAARPSPALRSRTVAVIAAAAVLSGQARSALAAAAEVGPLAAEESAAGKLAVSSLSFLLKSTPAALATGVKTMGIVKLATATAVVVLIAGGAFFYSQSHSVSPAPASASVSAIAPAGAPVPPPAPAPLPTEKAVFGGNRDFFIPINQTLHVEVANTPFGPYSMDMTARSDGNLVCIRHGVPGSSDIPMLIGPAQNMTWQPTSYAPNYLLAFDLTPNGIVLESVMVENQGNRIRCNWYSAASTDLVAGFTKLQSQTQAGQLSLQQRNTAVLGALQKTNRIPSDPKHRDLMLKAIMRMP